MKNIHLIPTDKPSRLFIDIDDNKLKITVPIGGEHMMNQHIYITNSEEIKEGDWFINSSNQVVKCNKELEIYLTTNFTKIPKHKIILTTDQDLIDDGVQAIDDDFIEWFVKNPSCEWVEVRYTVDFNSKAVIIIPKEEPINCPKCRTTDFKNCHSIRCPMRKEEPKTNLDRVPFPELVKELAEYYNSVPLVEEPKQETTSLEEAAERFSELQEASYTSQHKITYKHGFVDGAKWQYNDIIDKLYMHILSNEDDWSRNPQVEFQYFITQLKKK